METFLSERETPNHADHTKKIRNQMLKDEPRKIWEV